MENFINIYLRENLYPMKLFLLAFPSDISVTYLFWLVLVQIPMFSFYIRFLYVKFGYLLASVDNYPRLESVHFSSVAQSCPTLWDPMDCSTPGLPVHHQLPESTQTHVHWVGDTIQPSHPLSCPSPPAFNLSQHQGLFKWVSPSHQVAKALEFQLQHESFPWTPRTDLL